MKRWWHWSCVVLLLSLGLPAQAEFSTFRATYSLAKNEFEFAKTVMTLKGGEDQRFHYLAETQAVGVIAMLVGDTLRELSVWEFDQETLRPMRYEYHRDASKDERDRFVRLDFDWEKRIVENRVGEKEWRMPIPLGAVDKYLVNLALMYALREEVADQQFAVADGGHIKQYRFFIQGEERIDTPAGRFTAVKIEQRRKDREPALLWCAKELEYLPVRIQKLDDDGKSRLTLELERFETPYPANAER